MKKIFLVSFTAIIVLSMIVTLSITGCKTATTETTAAESTATETTTVSETTAAETSAEEIIEINLWDTNLPDTPNGQWLMGVIADYEAEHPNVKITYTQQPSLEMSAIMATLLAAKAGPDVMGYWPGINMFPIADSLVDLSKYATNDILDQYIPSIISTYYYLYDNSGKLLGMPNGGLGFHLIQYSKKLFKEAGITWEPTAENKYRMTWEEFLNACDALKAKGITPIAWGNNGGSMSQWYFDVMSLNYLEKDDWKKIFTGEQKFNDPKYVETATKLYDLYKRGYFNEGGLTLGWNEGLNMVNKGQAAMQDAFWGYNTEWAYTEMKDDYGIMLWPAINPSNSTAFAVESIIPGAAIVPIWSKHPDIAADIAIFISSTGEAQKYFDIVGGFSGRKDFDKSTITDPVDKMAWDMISNNENYPSVQDISWPPEIIPEFSGQSIEMLNGKITPQEFCDRLQTRFEELEYPWIIK